MKRTDCTLKMGDVHSLLDLMTSLNQGYYSHYTPPYWISGLNTESWLTILSTDMPQHIFRLLKKIMLKEPGLQDIVHYFSQRVKINEKLALIELFQSELSQGCFENLEELLQKIQNNFPDTGAYYYFEAEMYKKALEEKTG